MVFQLRYYRLQPFLEIAAIACSRQKSPHIKGKNSGIAQHLWNLAQHDAAGQTFGDGCLAYAGIAHQEWIVFLSPTEDLDHPLQLFRATDDRVDAPVTSLIVQVNAIGSQGLVIRFNASLVILLLFRPADGAFGAHAGRLGNAVGEIADRIQTGHILLLEEISRMAFPLGEDGY